MDKLIELNEDVYDNFKESFRDMVDDLQSCKFEDAVSKAYDLCAADNVLTFMENESFDPETCRFLLSLDNPLYSITRQLRQRGIVEYDPFAIIRCVDSMHNE